MSSQTRIAAALALSLGIASAAPAMPEELRRLASTMLGDSPLVADDAALWIALPRTPDPESLRRWPGLQLEASLAELSAGRPALLLGTPEFDIWRVFVPTADPVGNLEEWAAKSRTGIDWAPQNDRSRMARLPLKTAEGLPISDLYQMAFVFGRRDIASASLLLVPPGRWQQYAAARDTYLRSRDPKPLADDPTWALADARGDAATCVYAGFSPVRLVSGLHGRLPASSLMARLLEPDSWSVGWAVANADGGFATIEGGWTVARRGAAPLAEGGGHPLLARVSPEVAVAVAVRHQGADRVFELARSLVLERDYDGRESALAADERAFEQRLGFPIRRDILPLLGDGVVVGATSTRGRNLRWSCIVEAVDGPLLAAHVEQAAARFGGAVAATDRDGHRIVVARYPGDAVADEFAWTFGDDWLAFGADESHLRRFLHAASSAEPSLAERFAPVPGWRDAQSAAPVAIFARGHVLPAPVEFHFDGLALAFEPTAEGVSVRGGAILRDEDSIPERRDPFAAAAGM